MQIVSSFFLLFPENRLWHFMQSVSWGDTLHEMSKSFSVSLEKNGENLQNVSIPIKL